MHITRQGFGHYEDLFAVPYPFQKYDQVFVPEFNAGAMEQRRRGHLFLEGYVFRSKVPEAMVERRALTVLHELAHMWFGDLVTMRWWDNLWLNKYLAEYTSTLCMVESTRWTAPGPPSPPWRSRGPTGSRPSTHPIVADIRDLEDVEVNFDGITYAKGASVLKQLVAYVGREEFDEGVRRYFAEHAWGNTSSRTCWPSWRRPPGATFVSWSALWLEKAGITTLRPRVETADGTITTLSVEQETPEEHPVQRPHRLAVAGYDLGGSGRMERSWQIELDVDGPSTDVPGAVGKPLPDLLLVNDEDLAYAKIRLDEVSMATAVKHLRRLRRLAPPRPGLGGGVGHDPRRRDGAARLRRAGLREHRGRDRLVGGPHGAAPARLDGEVLRPPGTPARGLRRRGQPAALIAIAGPPRPAATCSCSW